MNRGCLMAQLPLADAGGGCSKVTAASMASKLHLINNGSSKRVRTRRKEGERRRKRRSEVVLLDEADDDVE